MMNSNFLWIGIVIGFCIAFPFGGNTILCLQNTFARGVKHGILTGIGAATAHAVYSALGISGLIEVEAILPSYTEILEVIGGFFLLYFGCRSILKTYKEITFVNDDVNLSDLNGRGKLFTTYVESTAFALTNPKSIILSVIMVSGSGILKAKTLSEVLFLSSVLGIFLGSTLWWLALVLLLSVAKSKLSYIHLIKLDRIFSLLVIICGLFFVFIGLRGVWLSQHIMDFLPVRMRNSF